MTTPREQAVIKVLMVCLGNICRSPTAHAVFQQRIAANGLQDKLIVDSAGTGDWHVGARPDKRALQAASRRGYSMDHLRARQVSAGDFEEYDYILAMDMNNLRDLQIMCPDDWKGKLELFLAYTDREEKIVPDPYNSGHDGFELVLDMVEEASDNLIEQLTSRHFS